jgi:chemotaxis protein methyltransferase CheR
MTAFEEEAAPPSSVGGPISVVLDRKRFARFAELITLTLGIKMPAAKVTLLENRLRGRMRQLGIDSLDAYEDYLFRSPGSSDELVHFCDVVTTNKTDFFREPQHFDFLRQTALPAAASERPGSELRIWCAGCSSGQEAYTLAMVANEFAEQRGARFSVLATDISTRMLAQARRAVYPESLIDPIAVELRKKYLLRSKDRRQGLVRIRPELRRSVSFERLNFMDRDYGRRGTYDAIFFRNVMIYFEKETQEAVVNRLAQNLSPGGYLFIGLSESLVGARVPLTTVGPAILRKM